MNLAMLIVFVIGGLVLVGGLILLLRGNEDTWIKDSDGTYVKHGNPSELPKEVQDQQDAVIGALQLYQQKKSSGMQFNSQCLGTSEDYAVDIVHVPRNSDDEKVENQCEAYRNGSVKHFIELDKDGNIVRVV